MTRTADGLSSLATVEAQIAYLVDLEALRDVLLRYCRGIDRCDEELLLSAYHPDAYDDHAGFFQGKAVDFVRLVMGEYKDKPPTQHVVTNARFEIDGDVAFGESYVVMRNADPDGPHPAAFARYVDRFERRDGEWRISYRRLVHEWDGTGTDGYGGSRRDRLDPSYTIVHEEPPV